MARIFSSIVAAMKIRPLPVMIGPPMLGDPQPKEAGTVMPKRFTWPSGICHFIWPLLISMAANVPQGVGVQGMPKGDMKISPSTA